MQCENDQAETALTMTTTSLGDGMTHRQRTAATTAKTTTTAAVAAAKWRRR